MTVSVRDTAFELLDRSPDTLTRPEQRLLVAHVDRAHWQQNGVALAAVAARMIDDGFSRDALDLLLECENPGLRVQQLHAWALSKSGAPRAASTILSRLREQGALDEETLGFSGSVERDLARVASTQQDRQLHWQRSLQHYLSAFDEFKDYWHGINASTLCARLGRLDESRELARRVVELCEAEIERDPASYFGLATLGQAALLTGDATKVRWAFNRAAQMENVGVARIGREKRDAEDLLAVLGRDPHDLDDVFPLARVGVFAGHRIGHEVPGLTPDSSDRIGAAIRALLASQNVKVGYAAAADGADILFCEAMQSVGGQIHVVLPADVESFREMSVQPQWVPRFDRLIGQADSLTVTSDLIDRGDASHLDYCNQVTLGLAQLNARELSSDVVGLTVWNGARGAPGGTADSVALWQANGLSVTALDPIDGHCTPAAERVPVEGIGDRRIMAMIKADVVGYSELSETEVAEYHESVLPRVASLCTEFGPVVQETFGDAFHLVFESVERAARFGLALQSYFRDTALMIRIAAHAGPLLACRDPIRGTANYTGRHASRVSRVEPVADENQILTTQQFAALIATKCPDQFELVYAGERELPKNFGSEHLYVLTSIE